VRPVQQFRLGTRGSQLALWQANEVARRIAAAGGPRCELVVIKTSGDHLQNAQLSEVGGKRLFVKEIEDALLRREIDLAVHSSKDMPVVLPEGLEIAAVLPREDPRDVVVLPVGSGFSWNSGNDPNPSEVDALQKTLGLSAAIGTGSVRRIAQLTSTFRGAHFVGIRGNLDTRLRKLDERQYDALVLAAAGLRRLGFESRISLALPPAVCVPAPGQGIVAVETRSDADGVREIVRTIDDAAAHTALLAERSMVAALGGGCQTPIGALAVAADGASLELTGVVATTDGARTIKAFASGPSTDPDALGASVAAQLLGQGARDMLADVSGRQSLGLGGSMMKSPADR
jgi:hydroxymethylbilane synthase